VGLIDQLRRRREKLRSDLAEVERAIVAVDLQPGNQSGIVRTMDQVDRMHISAGAKVTTAKRFGQACRARGYTMRSLAQTLGVSHASLSLALKGERSIGRHLAERIEALTGYQATRENWPVLKS
jgi:DNA-binding XRE family transcriptional regulator